MKSSPSITASLLLATLVFGCASRPVHEFSDRSALRQAFIQSVEEHYEGRTDGTLSEARDRGDVVRYVFLYDRPRNIAAKDRPAFRTTGEWVDLVIRVSESRSTWEVLVHQPVSGADPILRDQGEAITESMLSRLE